MHHDLPGSRGRALAAAALLLPLLSACGGSTEAKGDILYFSAIPDDNSTELTERYGLVADHLSGVLGIEIEYTPASSYEASVEAFRNGDIQLAWFGGLTSVQARDSVAGAVAIAQGKIDPHFKSYFIANVATGIEPAESFPMGMEGKTFTFGSRDSTSGRLMPEHFIRQNTGKSPEEFFAGDRNSYSDGSHRKTALLVEAGTFECGALNYNTYDSMVRDGELDPETCRVVWTTPEYPDYNWTAHPVLEERYGPGFTKRVQDALVGIEDPAILAALAREDGLIAAKNEDFAPIEALAAELGFLPE